MRRERTRKLGAHINISFKSGIAHISYTSFHVQINSGKIMHKRNVMHTEILKN